MSLDTAHVTQPSWRKRVALAVVVWLVACSGAFLWGLEPQPGLLALVVMAGFCVLWLYLDVSARTEPVRWDGRVEEPVTGRGQDPRLSLLSRVVSGHLDSRGAINHQMYHRLAAVTDERLMARHGITREADPGRAADLLGPDLTAYLDGPRDRRLTTTQIDHLLRRVERL